MISIPENVTTIGAPAFGGCVNLRTILVDNLNPAYASVGGVLFNKDKTALVKFPEGRGGVVTVPEGVLRIEAGALASGRIAGVSFPESLQSIGEAALAQSHVEAINIPNRVKSIDMLAFQSCFSLTNVVLGTSVESLGDQAFVDCIKLTRITMPTVLRQLGSRVFSRCASLNSVFFTGNAPQFDGPLNDSVIEDHIIKIYYAVGTKGWGEGYYRSPAVLWNVQMRSAGIDLGVGPPLFGFGIVSSTNLAAVLETSADLRNPFWTTLKAIPLSAGTNYFGDPRWTNAPAGFYRIRPW
jgi:hypothetical protein